MSFTVKADIKKVFFDRAQVASWIGKKQAAFLNNAGGYVRRVARNSMKLKGKARKKNTTKLALREAIELPVSSPGTPPYAHSEGDVTTLRNIQYGLSPNREGVVVGPLALNTKTGGLFGAGTTTSGTVPSLHEFGGTQLIREKLISTTSFSGPAGRDSRGRYTRGTRTTGKKWVPQGRRKPRPGQPTRRRAATYPPRPYMRPAMEKAMPKFPSLFFSAGGG